MINLTKQQRAAVESRGKTIVSASAGSGKTFVMIQKLVAAIENGADLDGVLAVTFTKKAAAQMKEKLRSALIARIENADAAMRTRLKMQLSKIPSANISTIHSFCGKLLRTYFYCVGIDGTFDVIASGDALAKEYKARAIDAMFDRYYDSGDGHFKILLKYYRKKRSDAGLKNLILSTYEKLRVYAGYSALLDGTADIYTNEGFEAVMQELAAVHREKYLSLKKAVADFADEFESTRTEYRKILEEMQSALEAAAYSSPFTPIPPIALTRKPLDKTEEEKALGEKFRRFREDINSRYKAVRGDLSDEQTERERFFKSGEVAVALSKVIKKFDEEYATVKRDENKLDYDDLQHLTLELLQDENIRREISSGYRYVYVDEYQDVNPVQDKIISLIGGDDVFLVGDVKQAIYGFRGSKSAFFSEKFNRFDEGGNALRLSDNFRSADGVLDFVNALFSRVMTEDICGFNYSEKSSMTGGGGYPENSGGAEIHIFGKDETEKVLPEVYSVKAGAREARHSREGLAVLEIVKRELCSQHFDLKSGRLVDTQPGDICILTRKNNKNAAGIVRALTDAGYSVSGAKEDNIFTRPEVRQMFDIVSYIDNSQQDIPLVTALLSPLGGLTCDELAAIRIAAKNSKKIPFTQCCENYAKLFRGETARKLNNFYIRTEELRGLAEVFTAAEIIDKILEDTGLEGVYSYGGGEKLKNVRRLADEGAGIGIAAFLTKLKDGGYEISSPAAAASDSIKIMTMHSSKGLEFPVVILSDVCAAFRGREQSELYADEKYAVAPKYFDDEKMLSLPTVLRRLLSGRAAREEIKNELNLFYVACTRAMCRLHIMAQEVPQFKPLDAASAGCYAKLFDMNEFHPEVLENFTDFSKGDRVTLISSPDEELQKKIEERFMREYSNQSSVNLPVKSSASAILRLSEQDAPFAVRELFSGEGETGTERGTAYHRFLELCDFSVKHTEGINAQIERFIADGRMPSGAKELLNADELAEILNMPVFEGLDNARLSREQEFLCRLPANQILDVAATDGVLVQGAIDLIARTEKGYKIIDYKYSRKSDEQLVEKYSRQLALYKKAASLILHVDENNIETVIVNIYARRQIILNIP